MEVKHLIADGFPAALRGMRNPLNSWDKSDSGYSMTHLVDENNNDTIVQEFTIGPNDLGLAQRLIKGGPEHAKYLRQINVSMDIIAPLYW